MRFVFELILERDRQTAWRAFDSPANLGRWQNTLKSVELVSGTQGQVGAVSKLTYVERGRESVLTETVSVRREPAEFGGIYDSGMAVNAIMIRFEPIEPQRTRWTVESELRFRGFGRLVAPFFRRLIRKRLQENVETFKARLEAGELTS